RKKRPTLAYGPPRAGRDGWVLRPAGCAERAASLEALHQVVWPFAALPERTASTSQNFHLLSQQPGSAHKSSRPQHPGLDSVFEEERERRGLLLRGLSNVLHEGQASGCIRRLKHPRQPLQQGPGQADDALRSCPRDRDVQPIHAIDELRFPQGVLGIGYTVTDSSGVGFLALHLVDRVYERFRRSVGERRHCHPSPRKSLICSTVLCGVESMSLRRSRSTVHGGLLASRWCSIRRSRHMTSPR